MIREERPFSLVVSAYMTALVTIATMIFQVYIPATEGYFNLGEAAVYTVAGLFGPKIGALAGGLGSALADLITGYVIYAPGTFVIKGVEGFVVGFLINRLKLIEKSWREVSVAVSSIVSALIAFIGFSYYSGGANVSSVVILSVDVYIPGWIWPIIALVSFTIITYMSLKVEPRTTIYIISMIVGGSLMIMGYFLYEYLLFLELAFYEIPFNILQCLTGIIVAIPSIKRLSRIIG
ncbi:MAG: ECF transporter S component [Candidatus Asgardarchaeia archaeon]